MTRRITVILIIVNALGLLAFAVMWFYASWLAPLGSTGRVTAIDRAQAIDTAKLAAFDPALAANVRYSLAAWIAEPERSSSVFNAVSGLLVCAVNLVVLVIAMVCDRRQPHGAQDPPSPAARPSDNRSL